MADDPAAVKQPTPECLFQMGEALAIMQALTVDAVREAGQGVRDQVKRCADLAMREATVERSRTTFARCLVEARRRRRA